MLRTLGEAVRPSHLEALAARGPGVSLEEALGAVL